MRGAPRLALLLLAGLTVAPLFCPVGPLGLSTARAEVPEELAAFSAIELSADLRLFSRRLQYKDDFYGFLRDYELPLGPSVALRGRWFPGAHATHEWPSMFGVELMFDRSFGIVSERSGRVRFPTLNRVVELNALARWMLGRHAVVARVGWGNHVYELQLDDPSVPSNLTIPDVPSVEFVYVRYGLEGQLFFARRLGAILSASFLQVLSTGGIESRVWFPRAEANGAELGAQLVVALAGGVELRAGFDYRWYFFDMHPEVGDNFVAGGALDQYLSFSTGLTYRY